MLAPVCLSANAIAESIERKPTHELTAMHAEIAEVLAAHGLVVYSCEEEWDAFVDAVRGLQAAAPSAYKKWEAVLTSLRGTRRIRQAAPPADTPVDSLDSLDSLRHSWGPCRGGCC